MYAPPGILQQDLFIVGFGKRDVVKELQVLIVVLRKHAWTDAQSFYSNFNLNMSTFSHVFSHFIFSPCW